MQRDHARLPSTTKSPQCPSGWRASTRTPRKSSKEYMKMMNRPLVALALILTVAAATQAEAASPYGGATMPRPPLQADPLGPRSEPSVTVAQAVAATQIEKSGYSSVRGVARNADGTWRAVSRNAGNTPVAVVLDGQGKVVETH